MPPGSAPALKCTHLHADTHLHIKKSKNKLTQFTIFKITCLQFKKISATGAEEMV